MALVRRQECLRDYLALSAAMLVRLRQVLKDRLARITTVIDADSMGA
jgi:hypothetical protein